VYLRDQVPPGVRIYSNIPAQVVWYAKHPALGISPRPGDLPLLEKDLPLDYVFLSYHRLGELYNIPEWRDLITAPRGSLERTLAGYGFVPEKSFEEGILFRRAGLKGGS